MAKHSFWMLLALLPLPLVLSAANTVAFPSGKSHFTACCTGQKARDRFRPLFITTGARLAWSAKEAFDAVGPVFASHGCRMLSAAGRSFGISLWSAPTQPFGPNWVKSHTSTELSERVM